MEKLHLPGKNVEKIKSNWTSEVSVSLWAQCDDERLLQLLRFNTVMCPKNDLNILNDQRFFRSYSNISRCQDSWSSNCEREVQGAGDIILTHGKDTTESRL